MKTTLAVISLATLTACGGGVGNVTFTTWGEAFIETGIPAQQGTTAGFVDGWSLKYTRFLVVLKDITIAEKDGTVRFKQPNGLLFDLARTGPFDVEKVTGIAAQRYDKVSYGIGPDPKLQIVNMANASQPDANLMRNNGFGLYLEGTATKGATTKSFQWGFTDDVVYADCANAEAGGTGLNVPTNATETVQLTVHGDHPFSDDLSSPDSKLRFDAIAAADTAPTDSVVTLDELAAVQLTALPLGTYGAAGFSDVRTLKDFVTALSHTVGHYRGEGECTPTKK